MKHFFLRIQKLRSRCALQRYFHIAKAASTQFAYLTKDKLEDMDLSLVFPLPFCGHYFHRVIVTKEMDIFLSKRYKMKEMDLIFPLIPGNPILVGWFCLSAISKGYQYSKFSCTEESFQKSWGTFDNSKFEVLAPDRRPNRSNLPSGTSNSRFNLRGPLKKSFCII